MENRGKVRIKRGARLPDDRENAFAAPNVNEGK